jgi:GMP synthase (glutamine-hydrolysing)
VKDGAILILKTGEALAPVKRQYGDFEDWIARGLGLSVDALEVASVHVGDPLPPASDLSGVVITGSPLMVTDRADWSEASARWLREIVERDALPVLGLCYGHQLLAHAMGGEVGPNPMGREMGTVDVQFAPASSTAGGTSAGDGLAPLFEPGCFPGHMSHVESVLRPPDGARILATTALDPHSVLAIGPRQWGVQFHPEFDRDIMRGYVEARREILTSEGLDPKTMIKETIETPVLTGVLARFAEIVRKASYG